MVSTLRPRHGPSSRNKQPPEQTALLCGSFLQRLPVFNNNMERLGPVDSSHRGSTCEQMGFPQTPAQSPLVASSISYSSRLSPLSVLTRLVSQYLLSSYYMPGMVLGSHPELPSHLVDLNLAFGAYLFTDLLTSYQTEHGVH